MACFMCSIVAVTPPTSTPAYYTRTHADSRKPQSHCCSQLLRAHCFATTYDALVRASPWNTTAIERYITLIVPLFKSFTNFMDLVNTQPTSCYVGACEKRTVAIYYSCLTTSISIVHVSFGSAVCHRSLRCECVWFVVGWQTYLLSSLMSRHWWSIQVDFYCKWRRQADSSVEQCAS